MSKRALFTSLILLVVLAMTLASCATSNKAIDGNASTEWSSNGDGNGAWIEIGG